MVFRMNEELKVHSSKTSHAKIAGVPCQNCWELWSISMEGFPDNLRCAKYISRLVTILHKIVSENGEFFSSLRKVWNSLISTWMVSGESTQYTVWTVLPVWSSHVTRASPAEPGGPAAASCSIPVLRPGRCCSPPDIASQPATDPRAVELPAGVSVGEQTGRERLLSTCLWREGWEGGRVWWGTAGNMLGFQCYQVIVLNCLSIKSSLSVSKLNIK